MDSTGFFRKSPRKAFLYAIRESRGKLAVMYFCIIVGNALYYSVPYFLSVLVDSMTAAGPFIGTWFEVLRQFSGPLVGIALVLVGAEICYRIGHMLETYIATKAFDRITTHLYETILARPVAYFEEKFSGEINRRIEQISEATKFFIEVFPWEIGWPVLAIIMTIFLLGTVHAYLVWTFVVWLVLFSLFSYMLLRWSYKVSSRVSKKMADLSGTMVDVLGNAHLVNTFAAYGYERAHYRGYMDDAIATDKYARWVFVANKFQQGSSMVILSLALTLVGVFLFRNGSITIGGFVVIVATVPTFGGLIWTIGDIVNRGVMKVSEFKNALESLDTEVEIIKEGSQELILKQAGEASVEFKDISFLYPRSKEAVLENFSLAIKPGEKVGLVGRSGAGKSTIVKLLLGTYNPTSGSISIAGKDTASVSLQSLRGNIAFVPQDTALFHRSLYKNIQYAKPTATKEEVVAASIRAHAHDFIEQYPRQYETLVGERGVKLSGGQRQRIALARAILKNSPILVLDEATSSLDSESEEIVQKGLQELFEHRTVLAIAHRLSTLRSMDRIIVLENGRIVEDGAPEALLARKDGVFKSMWELQKNGFLA